MTGTEKQIKWAEEVKAKIETECTPLRGRGAHFDKMMDFILSIDAASFWIDYCDYNLKTLLSSLIGEGLRTKGLDFSDLAKSDREGNITHGKLA